MSLLGNVRQTLGEAAATALDVGQNLSAQAQAQLNIKKLQLDQAKRLHELGAKTYEWYKTGSLVVSGQVPHDVRDLCHQLDGIQHQLEDEQHRLEEMKQQAAMRGAAGTDDAVDAPQSGSDLPAIGMASNKSNASGVSGSATPYEVYEVNNTGGGSPFPPGRPETSGVPTTYGASGSSVPPASTSTYAMTPGPDVSPLPVPPGPGPDLPRTPSESPVSPTLPPVPPSGPGVPSNPDMPPTMPPPDPPSGPMPGGPSGPTI